MAEERSSCSMEVGEAPTRQLKFHQNKELIDGLRMFGLL